MDKVQKFEYATNVEKYLEENHIYEKFEGLLEQLLVHKPVKPLDFLIEKLQQAPTRRVFLMGAPGCLKQDNAQEIAKKFGWDYLSAGELLRKEVKDKTEKGKRIDECLKKNQYVDDEVVVDVVCLAVQDCESKGKSWILEGFPRTKTQALALQKKAIIPDQFILLKTDNACSVDRVQQKCMEADPKMKGKEKDEMTPEQKEELDGVAKQVLLEYEMNISGVQAAFDQFIFEHDCADKQQTDVCAELYRILGLRFKSNAPRRPPRVIISGPPGTGKDTQAKLLAQKFGLVHISARALLKNEMQNNKEAADTIRKSFDEAEPIAEDLINAVIEKRIKQGDCKVNGFVLEGYPYSKTQITYIRSWKIKPSVLFMFGATADFKQEAIRRLESRKIDPKTGVIYDGNQEIDATIEARLVTQAKDTDKNIRKKFDQWKPVQELLEENFRAQIQNVDCDVPIAELENLLADIIQNPN